jgi:hypothetical protein
LLINKPPTPAALQIILPLNGLFSILLTRENKGILFINVESPFFILDDINESPEYITLNKATPFCNNI